MPYGMNMLLWTADATGENFLALFERLKKMGFDSVEIPVMTPDLKKYAELGRRLENMGLKRTAVTILTSETNLIGTDKKQREGGVAHLKAVAESCQALGSSRWSGPFMPLWEFSPVRAPRMRNGSWPLKGYARPPRSRKCGVTLGAEYLNRFETYLLNCTADAARFVAEVNHPNCRMMYDTFHANIEEKNIAEAISPAARTCCHVHISENDRSTPGQGASAGTKPSTRSRRSGYDGWMIVEAFGLALPELAAATKIWRRMFESEEQLARDALAFMKSEWESV